MSISKKFYNLALVLVALLALVGCTLPTSFSRTVSEAEADLEVVAGRVEYTTEQLTVTSDLSFPTETQWAERITYTWYSSNEAVIATDGTVTRPEFGQGNADVTIKVVITAEYTKLDDGTYQPGTVSTEKEWVFTVVEAAEVMTIQNILNKAVAGELKSGDAINFTGTIVAYEIGDYTNIYVHDGTEGIYVYTSYPEAKIGDEVEVQGELGFYGGCYQVATGGTVKLVSEGKELPEVIETSVSEYIAAFPENGVMGGRLYNVDAKVAIVQSGNYTNVYLEDPFTGERINVYYKTAFAYIPGAEAYETYLDYFQQWEGKYVNITVVSKDTDTSATSSTNGYNRVALAPCEIVEIEKPELSDEQQAQIIVNNLALEDQYTADFELPTEASWEVVSGTGIELVEGKAVVTQANVVQTVVLKATVTVGEAVLTKEFTVVIPGAVLETISYDEAKELAGTTKDQYTADKYYLEGIITEVYNTTYGNMYITDGVSTFCIYGTYSADGKDRYDAMENAPQVGDRVIVYGILGYYNDYQMKNGWIVAQEPGTELETVSNTKAIELSGTEKNTYTDEKYSVKGIVTEVVNTTYGNIYVKDIYGVSFYIYGVYSVDGSVRYDAMEKAPQVGDFVVLSGVLGYYNDAQMKNGWLLQLNEEVYVTPDVPEHEHVKCETCGLCTTEDCTGAEEEKCPGHEVVGEEVTVSVTVVDYATANGWVNSTLYSSMVVDSNITITVSGTAVGSYGLNSGKYYTNGNAWRIYQNEKPQITFSAVAGCKIVSVKVTYTVDKTGILTLDGANVETDTIVAVNGSSITFSVGNTGTATNGQVRITAVEVVYVCGSSTPEVPEHTHVKCETCGLCTAADCTGTEEEKCAGHVVEPTKKEITIKEALEIANSYAHNTYSPEKYIITGTVNDLYNTVYGNMHLLDAEGNDITIYGLYFEGSKYGDYSGTKPVEGDVITVEGVLGTYNGKPQMKDADFVAFASVEETPTHEHVKCETCGLCTAADCTGTEEEKCQGHTPAVIEQSESLDVIASEGALAADKLSISWAATNFVFTTEKGSQTNAIRTSDTDHFRVYQGNNAVVSAVEGAKITKVVITCTSTSYANVCQTSAQGAGLTAEVSGLVVTITLAEEASSISFAVTAQWRFNNIEVYYQ